MYFVCVCNVDGMRVLVYASVSVCIYACALKLDFLILQTEGRKEMFYLTTHSTHFIYDYMASDIW